MRIADEQTGGIIFLGIERLCPALSRISASRKTKKTSAPRAKPEGAVGSRTPKHATACERGDAVFCRRVGQTPNPKPFQTSPAVSEHRDSECSGGAVKHTQTPEKCASPVSSLRLSTCSTLECPALRTVPSRASLLSTKNQNGLRNQFHLSPYKPLTAHRKSTTSSYQNRPQTKPQTTNNPHKNHKQTTAKHTKQPQIITGIKHYPAYFII